MPVESAAIASRSESFHVPGEGLHWLAEASLTLAMLEKARLQDALANSSSQCSELLWTLEMPGNAPQGIPMASVYLVHVHPRPLMFPKVKRSYDDISLYFTKRSNNILKALIFHFILSIKWQSPHFFGKVITAYQFYINTMARANCSWWFGFFSYFSS